MNAFNINLFLLFIFLQGKLQQYHLKLTSLLADNDAFKQKVQAYESKVRLFGKRDKRKVFLLNFFYLILLGGRL